MSSIPLNSPLNEGDTVFHPKFGRGVVEIDRQQTVLVRFGQQYERVDRSELERRLSLADRFHAGTWDAPLEVMNRIQAEAIRSVHDEWGVFAAARIELLPHQLWVCRQVNSASPTRWLVADDVGLGKTVEAGMILSPLLTRGEIRRLLILCPASLVAQWQRRMYDMFDIRLTAYSTEQDTPRSNFWHMQDRVVASFHTLRMDRNDRKKRLIESDPFDMVLVDEAHHLNNDKTTGSTLGYRLIRDLEEAGRIRSMVFFTGTPHRGKDYGFLSLLSLLRPEQFDPEKPTGPQLKNLPDVLIRNNKVNVTDLRGERLFQPLKVASEDYTYSEEEAAFYQMLTEFITAGHAYSKKLNRTQGEAVMLALIALQKLASSSVAAIRRAIRRRLNRVGETRQTLTQLLEKKAKLEEEDTPEDQDRLSELDEEIASAHLAVALIEDEEPALRKLLVAAEAVTSETKMETILNTLETTFAGRSVLLFTEYKATQALLASRLMTRFGRDSVSFINGDSALTEVTLPDGTVTTLTEPRESAAERFNSGDLRFLISTEAAGEGIDLQGFCHTLIHVDLPWNPMRLHQRVGRLYRYGQKHAVDVRLYHNPDTVESRIWGLLNEKLERINAAMRAAMDEPEDIQELVLGMTSSTLFTELFRDAPRSRDGLRDWFDRKTGDFGGKDVLDTVRHLIGDSRRFDFKQMSRLIPKIDLPALRPFFELALTLGNRRPTAEADTPVLSFKTPDEWRPNNPAVRTEYRQVTFERGLSTGKNKVTLLGIGNPVVDVALESGLAREAYLSAIPTEILDAPLFVFRIYSEESTDTSGPQPLIAGVFLREEGPDILTDANLLEWLNHLPVRRPVLAQRHIPAEGLPFDTMLPSAEAALRNALGATITHRFRHPALEVVAALLPYREEGVHRKTQPGADSITV